MQLLLSVTVVMHLTMSVSTTGSPYELAFYDGDEFGWVKLCCRNSATAEKLDIATVMFYVNRTSVYDADLRNREDFEIEELLLEKCIHFPLYPHLEGNFTCAIRNDEANVMESPPLTLICKYYYCFISIAVCM